MSMRRLLYDNFVIGSGVTYAAGSRWSYASTRIVSAIPNPGGGLSGGLYAAPPARPTNQVNIRLIEHQKSRPQSEIQLLFGLAIALVTSTAVLIQHRLNEPHVAYRALNERDPSRSMGTVPRMRLTPSEDTIDTTGPVDA